MGILTFDKEAFRELVEDYDAPELPNASHGFTDRSASDEAWWASMNSEEPGPIGQATVIFPGISLVAELRADIEYYIGMGSDYGDFMARIVGSILRRVQFTGARTVAEYLDRRAALDAEGDR